MSVRQERLSLSANFRAAQSFLGVAEDGAKLARAILNGRPGHFESDVEKDDRVNQRNRCLRRLEEAWVSVDLAGVWQRLIDKGEA